jgi:NADP-dependent 3-hydroxy acid dehydrogenase YdfG
MQFDVKRGERLPDEAIDELQPMMRQVLGNPEDVADAVLYAVTQPIEVDIAEVVVRQHHVQRPVLSGAWERLGL